MIVYPTILTTSGQKYHHFGPFYSTNNDTSTLQPVITYIRIRQEIICECCGSIGHKDDYFIIRVPKSIPPSLRRKMNQFNALHGDDTTDPPR